jgi:AAA+ ATPase superfamily predicted ATPase
MGMAAELWDREQELDRLKESSGKAGFGYVTGRRRIGKTALLKEACEEFGGLYHQAVEGTPQQQIEHIVDEWGGKLPLLKDVVPKNWNEFLKLLSREKLPPLLVFDEFPYWVQGDSALPSVLQKWVDHELPKKKTFLWVSGSSQTMLYSQFLNQSSPLYGRASRHIHLQGLPFFWFCKALGYSSKDPVSFERYSLVGGVPHYWKMMPKGSVISQAENLYFETGSLLAEEPRFIAQDEGIMGVIPKAIMDLVGRGVTKPSEIAARLGTVQGNLSRPLQLLQELGLIGRELPFGESTRTTKKVLYRIFDAPLSFYYAVFLPNRARWAGMSRSERENVIHLHVTRQWEIFCRSFFAEAGRYWEGDIEIDFIAPLDGKKGHLVAECKWSALSASESRSLLEDLKQRFSKTQLARKIKNPEFRVFSKKDLKDFAGGSLDIGAMKFRKISA